MLFRREGLNEQGIEFIPVSKIAETGLILHGEKEFKVSLVDGTEEFVKIPDQCASQLFGDVFFGLTTAFSLMPVIHRNCGKPSAEPLQLIDPNPEFAIA